MKNKKINKIIDLHQDTLLHENNRQYFSDHYQTSFEDLKKQNIECVVCTAFPDPKDRNYFSEENNLLIEKDLKEYVQIIKEDPGLFLVKNKKDFNLELENKTKIILHIEGLNVEVEETILIKRLDYWFDLGLRSVGVVWNKDNFLGGGTEGDYELGLTNIGEKVIDWCLNKGVIVDLAHSNNKTFDDISDILIKNKKPLYISHGACKELNNNVRNYSVEQLKKISKNNGVMGIFFSSKFTKINSNLNNSSIDDVAEHFNFAIKKMGIDHVGIGTDFGGLINGLIDGLDSVDNLNKFLNTLSEKLKLSSGDIDKITYKNAQRVISEYLK